jgi:hypothetical protein
MSPDTDGRYVHSTTRVLLIINRVTTHREAAGRAAVCSDAGHTGRLEYAVSCMRKAIKMNLNRTSTSAFLNFVVLEHEPG